MKFTVLFPLIVAFASALANAIRPNMTVQEWVLAVCLALTSAASHYMPGGPGSSQGQPPAAPSAGAGAVKAQGS
jgi:hypothetical protein